jgi:uroporphyrinogen decarboxylase
VTLQPLERFPLDAAIVFSDILTIPDAMGLGLAFAEGEGPRFERPLRDEKDVLGLAVPDLAQLDYVFGAVRESKRAIAGRVPLIGFSGSPFTLACYMVEGSGSDNWRTLKTMLHTRPDLLHQILEVNARAVTGYLNAQIDAGADAVMLFDTWGGILAHDQYEEFSLKYSRAIFQQVKKAPTILFTKGGGPWLDAMMSCGCAAVGLDWTADARAARKLAGGKVALQGNLDPVALFAPPERVREAARKVLESFGAAPGHIFNLGHGILPQTPVESVAALVDEVRAYSAAQRRNAAAKP